MTMMLRGCVLAAAMALMAGQAAAASQADAASQAAGRARLNGGLITAPYTRASGRVVPSGGPDARALDRGIGRKTRIERRDDEIDRRICIGC